MRKTITKARCINHITVFSFLALISILVLGVFVLKLIEDMAKGTELFIPGITVLFAVVILVFIFSVTRIVKYIRLLKRF